MIFRFVTGRLGTGKTLCSVGIASRYLKQGRMVATNVDLYPENFKNKRNRLTRIYRLPDHPSSTDLQSLPIGNPTLVMKNGEWVPGPDYDPSQNSLLMLDELAQFLNTRSYQNKDRGNIISVLVLLRKMGWDAIFIVQHIDMVDKQIREGLAQETGYCRDMSRIPVPILGALTRKLFGKALRFAKSFRVTFRDGYSESGVKIEIVKIHSGDIKRLKNLYNTAQILSPDYYPRWAINHHGTAGTHMLLTPWHFEGYKLPDPVSWKVRLSRVLVLSVFLIAYPFAKLIPSKIWHFSRV